mmetsp:Transcript_12861/g.39252  ORF Transcript_12861/g.39252 Transcript_12861/m.39252 type:complete len:193 (-) Transcript_12861:138-716(-)
MQQEKHQYIASKATSTCKLNVLAFRAEMSPAISMVMELAKATGMVGGRLHPSNLHSRRQGRSRGSLETSLMAEMLSSKSGQDDKRKELARIASRVVRSSCVMLGKWPNEVTIVQHSNLAWRSRFRDTQNHRRRCEVDLTAMAHRYQRSGSLSPTSKMKPKAAKIAAAAMPSLMRSLNSCWLLAATRFSLPSK